MKTKIIIVLLAVLFGFGAFGNFEAHAVTLPFNDEFTNGNWNTNWVIDSAAGNLAPIPGVEPGKTDIIVFRVPTGAVKGKNGTNKIMTRGGDALGYGTYEARFKLKDVSFQDSNTGVYVGMGLWNFDGPLQQEVMMGFYYEPGAHDYLQLLTTKNRPRGLASDPDHLYHSKIEDTGTVLSDFSGTYRTIKFDYQPGIVKGYLDGSLVLTKTDLIPSEPMTLVIGARVTGGTLSSDMNVVWDYVKISTPEGPACDGETFTYKVQNEGGTARVYNSSGVEDSCSNTNHSTAIQCVLDKLGAGKILLIGDFTARNTIYLPSNITWKLCGSIKLGNDINKIVIADSPSGATNINMSGGIYDGNKANQLVSAADDHVIKFSKVTNSHFSDMIVQNAVNDDFTLDTQSNNNTVERVIGRWAGTGYTGPGATNDGNGLDDKGDHNTWTDCIAEDNYSDNWVIKSRDSTFIRAIGRGSLNAVGFGPFGDRNITGNKFYDIKAYNNIHAGFAINLPPKAQGHGYKIENNFIQGEFYNNGTNGMRIKNSTTDGSIKNNTIDIITHNNGAIGFWVETTRINNTSGPLIACQNETSDLTSQGSSNIFTAYHYAGTPLPVINKGSSTVNVVDFTCNPTSVSGVWAVDRFCSAGGICGGPTPTPTPTPSLSPTPTGSPAPSVSPTPGPSGTPILPDGSGHYKEFTKSAVLVFKDAAKMLLRVIGGLAFLVFVLSGIYYIMSRGNPDGVTKAKKMLYYAILGLIVALLSYAVLTVIERVAT